VRAPAASSGSSSHSSTLIHRRMTSCSPSSNIWPGRIRNDVNPSRFTTVLCTPTNCLLYTQWADLNTRHLGIRYRYFLVLKKLDFSHTKKLPVFGIGDLAVIISVADPGCLSRIPDPDFSIPDPNFSIPDPGSTSILTQKIVSNFSEI
jgi:hypothetical protein